ncbi:YARHG domain-containing protein [Pinisolibacter sp.]|uniref:YARHG domain-containing protein n=1 Tax=Pinisolibacter sp. TaxID=2172024 RepID=UPI002FDE6E29
MPHSTLRLAAVALALSAVPAAAACYDVFGCSNRDYFSYRDLVSGPNCEFLWQMRNSIYQENGYCFKTARGIATFGNDGCRYTSDGAVPMNRIERANVSAIKRAESALGCR